MDREQAIQKATDFYSRNVDPDSGANTIQMWMADFHIAMSAERDAENEKLWEALDKFRELLNRN